MTSSNRPLHPHVSAPIAVLALGLLLAADAHAFEGGVHKDITEKVAKEFGYKPEAIALLVKGNLDSDKKESDAPGGEWYVPAAHFDSEAFSAGALRLRTKRDLALAALNECDWGVSLEAMGRALHGIQDFYSHSNYITKYPDEKKLADLYSLTDPSRDDRKAPVNCAAPTQADPLTSGYYRYTGAELAANSQLWIQVPANRCLHDDAGAVDPGLHKDHDKRTGHADAVARATAATRQFFASMDLELKARYPHSPEMITYVRSNRSDKTCHEAHLRTQSMTLMSARGEAVTWVTPGTGHWGSWRLAGCPAGTWATGFALRRETYQGPELKDHDDSALNSVKLTCSGGAVIDPGGGPWGTWSSTMPCGANKYLTAAKVRIEPPQADKDDSAANDVVFQCSNKTRSETDTLQIKRTDDAGKWGTEGPMTACPAGTAVCGLSIRVEDLQAGGDDTAMNGLALHCCKLK